jgi:hypothetical protein
MYERGTGLASIKRALELRVASQRRLVASCLCPPRVQGVNTWQLSSYLRVAWGQWLH